MAGSKGQGRKKEKKNDKENQSRNQPNPVDVKKAFGAANSILEETYAATNSQSQSKMKLLRPYSSFAKPEFYQPPDWQWRREAAKGKNNKTKYFPDEAAAVDAIAHKPMIPGQSKSE